MFRDKAMGPPHSFPHLSPRSETAAGDRPTVSGKTAGKPSIPEPKRLSCQINLSDILPKCRPTGCFATSKLVFRTYENSFAQCKYSSAEGCTQLLRLWKPIEFGTVWKEC